MQRNYNRDILEWKQFPPEYDMIWCDPPWEQRMVKYFETIMKKESGVEKPENTIEDILAKLAKLADPKKLLIIEYSVKGMELVRSTMQRYGHKLHRTHGRTQSNGKPFVVMVFNQAVPISPEKGFKCVTETLNSLPDVKTVFDPFAGIGLTAKAVQAAGKIYIGSEINPARFEKLCLQNPES